MVCRPPKVLHSYSIVMYSLALALHGVLKLFFNLLHLYHNPHCNGSNQHANWLSSRVESSTVVANQRSGSEIARADSLGRYLAPKGLPPPIGFAFSLWVICLLPFLFLFYSVGYWIPAWGLCTKTANETTLPLGDHLARNSGVVNRLNLSPWRYPPLRCPRFNVM